MAHTAAGVSYNEIPLVLFAGQFTKVLVRCFFTILFCKVADFLHFWRVNGWYLGVKDENNAALDVTYLFMLFKIFTFPQTCSYRVLKRLGKWQRWFWREF